MRQSPTIFYSKRRRGVVRTRLTLFWILLSAGVSVLFVVSFQPASSGFARAAKSPVVNSERQNGRRFDAHAAAASHALAPATAHALTLLLPIDVDRSDDDASANLCTPAANDCSLRGAVSFANTVPGTTINLPAGTYNLTTSGAGEGFSGNNSIGDLDVRGNNTSIIGAGAASTIIQQTTTARVIEVNPFLDAGFNFSISGVTISGGQENTGVGGGGIISGAVNNTTTITDSIISGNSATGSGTFGGGGLCNTGGSVNISGTTFSGNSTIGSGGAVSYSAGDLLNRASVGSLTVTSSSFSNNTAQSTSAGGGAIDIFNFNLASTSAQISTSGFVSNNAANGRGGAVIVESGSASIEYSRLVGNSAAAGGRTVHRTSGTLVANNNWWGLNTGPAMTANSGGSILSWLQLRAVADPNQACSGATVNLNADIYGTADNTGPTNPVMNCPGASCALNGLPPFTGTVGGTTTSYVNGAATGSFVAGTDSPTATADSESVTATFTVGGNTTATTPDDQTVCAGATADFSTSAGGTGPFHYAWTLDGSPFNGDSPSISVPTGSLSAGAHAISVTVSGECDSVVRNATLTVQEGTSTTDPADQTVCKGATATFSTTPSGSGPFHYAWTVDGSPFGGDTSSINVDTTSMSVGDHAVSVTVTGACGDPVSQSATLTVQENTSTTDPPDQTVCQGATANFSTTASGTGPFHYAWTVDGSPTGGDASSIGVDTTSLSVGDHNVSVTVSGECGSATQTATLTVQAPTSTSDPADQTVCQGAPANFSTTASGTGPFHYAWTLDGNPYNGDSPNITIDTTTLGVGNHAVSVTVTGTCVSATQNASLTVQATTTTTDPPDQTVCAGATANFSTTAGGTGPFHYTWTLDGLPYNGDSPTISINTTGMTQGPHTVTVTTSGECGSASQTAILNVQNSAPSITVANNNISMWPPNHKYQNFTMNDFSVSASSGCDGNLTNSVTIVNVTSDELDDNPGGGDGNTTNDIVIAADCKSVQLRRERDGALDGRVYVVTFQVTDSVGNTATATARVNVPRNNSGAAAVDSGPRNTRTCP